jgi:hypothetical protein
MLINTARKQGESRVVEGVEACLARNEGVRAFMSDEGVMAMYAELYGDLVAKKPADATNGQASIHIHGPE